MTTPLAGALALVGLYVLVTTTSALCLTLHYPYAIAATVGSLMALTIIPSIPFVLSPRSILKCKSHLSERQLARVYQQTVEALASAIAAQDPFECHHVHRVRETARIIATQMKLSKHEIEGIETAAILHDAGKLGVPSHLLLKPGPLDPDEFAKIANHATIGAEMIEGIDFPWEIAPMIRHHHERYDGSGYPDKLSGVDIPLGARVIAVAEVYDALISDRSYKKGWSHHEAVNHIEKLAGSHFDPDVVRMFLEAEKEIEAVIGRYPLPKPSECHIYATKQRGAFEMIAQASRELMSLLEIADTLSCTLEIDEVAALLAHRTRRFTEAATCVVFLLDDTDPTRLVARFAVGKHEEILRGAQARVGRGVTGRAASKMKSYVGSYDPNDLFLAHRIRKGIGIKSCMVVPMIYFGKLIGTLNLYDDSPDTFSKNDLATVESIASRAALSIHNALVFQSVRESSMKDPLTGLYNCRYLDTLIEHEINRASRKGGYLSVLQLDLDNFKAVNDTFGHARGDEVLKDVAKLFLNCVRSYDTVVRSGGDEFVAILPDTGTKEAERTARRIQTAVESYSRHKLADCPHPFGVSVGTATYPQDAKDAKSLLQAADSNMYINKRFRKQIKSAA
ncbi:MAG: diguanylate cyclase [Armatimonadota bacterium]